MKAEGDSQTPASKPRISTSRNYPAVEEGRVGLEPTRWCLTNTCSAAELPTHSESALRESNPPVQLGRLMPLTIGQGHVLYSSGSRGTRTHNGVTRTINRSESAQRQVREGR